MLIDTFLSSYHQLTRKKKHRKDVSSVRKKRRGRKADINVKPVQAIRDFAQLLALKFFTQLLSKLAYIKRVAPIFKTLFIENILESN